MHQNCNPARISVVIPFRNASAHLGECLEALRRSNQAPHEIILVDDASTDGGAGIARRAGAQLLTLPEPRGPAFARNRGAERATGDFLFFIDSDVLCHRDTLSKVAASFGADPGLTAVIGSYDGDPPARNFLSRYKNLTHHFVHQHGSEQASTFWTGCGAVRRAEFIESCGFDESYPRPSIEDIELGYRLRAAGRRIALRKDLQVRHAKIWNLGSLLHSDIFDRAIPWTALQLRYGALLDDLNVSAAQRVAAGAAWVAAAGGVGALAYPPLGTMAAGGLAVLAWINARLYNFYFHKGGIAFGLGCIGMHTLYYLYSTLAFLAGCAQFLRHRNSPLSVARSDVPGTDRP